MQEWIGYIRREALNIATAHMAKGTLIATSYNSKTCRTKASSSRRALQATGYDGPHWHRRSSIPTEALTTKCTTFLFATTHRAGSLKQGDI